MKYSDMQKSMEFILKHFPDDFIEAEHDVIFGPGTEPDDLPQEIQDGLDEHGWFYSSEYDCWCHFV